MAADLLALISVELGRTDALDWFIGSCLCEGGIWKHPRTSDGISAVRVLEHGADNLRVAGQIWEINQSLHAFWLEIARDTTLGRFAWVLYFDVTSARRALHAHVDNENAEDVDWSAKLTGQAMVQDDELVLVPASTRIETKDTSESWGNRED